MSSTYYLNRGGKAFGPYNLNQLKLAISQGKLKAADIISTAASSSGKPASQYAELVSFFNSPPVSPPQLATNPSSPNAAPSGMAGITNAYWLKSDEPEPVPTQNRPAKNKNAFKPDPVMLIGGGLLAIGGVGTLIGFIVFSMSGVKAWNDMQEETRRNVDAIAGQVQSDLNTISNGKRSSSYSSPQNTENNTSRSGPSSPAPPKNKEIKVSLNVGDATLTLKETGWSHVKVACNNGLVAEADWRRNPANEFGYDISEPVVNQTTNRLAVMVLLRGVIANYLNGKY